MSKTPTAALQHAPPLQAEEVPHESPSTEKGTVGAIYIDWAPNDPDNPFHWPSRRKWVTCGVGFAFGWQIALTATGYAAAQAPLTQEFHCSPVAFLTGHTAYMVTISFAPLIFAPLSEVLGRRNIFVIGSFISTLFYLPQALATNLATIIVARAILGVTTAVGNSVVAGIVSDVFVPAERGLPMTIFIMANYFGQAISPVISAHLIDSSVGWRFIFWWQMIVSGIIFVAMYLFLHESRGCAILSARARLLTKQTGQLHKCRADDERGNLPHMIRTSLSRPLLYLTTEPVTIAFSIWAAFAYALIFMSLSSVPIAFRVAYGWSAQRSSFVLLGIAAGGVLGWLVSFAQEWLYARDIKKHGGRAPPESRLYYPCLGAILFPAGLYMFAWGTRSQVSPAVGIVGFIIMLWGLFPIWTGVFSYLADVYERYASSAIAAQSWLRNIVGGCLRKT